MDFLLLIVGLVILIASGELLVRGSVAVALNFKISALVIGVTVVSIGTSAPELLVSIQAVLSNHHDISIGNVVGSNIANLALVLGVTAIIFPVAIKKDSIRIDWPVMMMASVVLYLLMLNKSLNFTEGLIFVAALITYVVWLIRRSRKEGLKKAALTDKYFQKGSYLSMFKNVVFIVLGCIGLVFGADWFVEGAVGIARVLGVSERVIAISLVALGTSLPELVTSGVAAFRKETDIAIGNLIGSCIFNILGILGVTSIIHQISVNEKIIQFDIFWMLGISLLLFPLMLIGRKINRVKGMTLLAAYIIYMIVIFG